MSVRDYDKLSKKIVLGKPIVVVICDHNPGNFKKTSIAKYGSLANAIKDRMQDLIPSCKGTGIVIGGHSASGEASLAAWQNGLIHDLNPLGYIGLDPYEIGENTIDEGNTLTLPAIFWGFTKTTCLVAKEKAAEAGYAITSSNARVLYTVHNENGCKITHCVFTDHGCGVKPFTCSTQDDFDWIYEYVASSIHLFLDAIAHGNTFTREYFELDGTPVDLSLRVNTDEVTLQDMAKGRLGSLQTKF